MTINEDSKKLKNGFLILDFGSQVTMLIARRLRDLGYYCEIRSYQTDIETIKNLEPSGIILSGGPFSVYDESAPQMNVKQLLVVAPVLGICYGMQLLAQQMKGEVQSAKNREYGLKKIHWKQALKNIPQAHTVWMSHGDVVVKLPEGASLLCETDSHIAGFKGDNYWAVQYHPEVSHSEFGTEFLLAFAESTGAKKEWDNTQLYEHAKKIILDTVTPESHVLCALSGGVDSSVVATLLTKTLGADRVHCVFLDNGLLRLNEYEDVLAQYKKIGLNVIGVNAAADFLKALKGLSDPEQKRKAIGKTFIEIFERTITDKLAAFKKQIKYLAQGTLYPDVIESVSSIGNSVTIKSHHNVGGLPEKMNLKLVEPVRLFFKDEVRRLGKELGLNSQIIDRHPFPGPGLAIRIIGEVTENKLATLKKADAVFIEELRKHDLYAKIWQAACILTSIQTVGVMGDGRTYESVLALRAVTSTDGMTADWYEFESSFLKRTSNKITNEVKGINRVVYDITSKPPATIEWE